MTHKVWHPSFETSVGTPTRQSQSGERHKTACITSCDANNLKCEKNWNSAEFRLKKNQNLRAISQLRRLSFWVPKRLGIDVKSPIERETLIKCDRRCQLYRRRN